MIKEYLKFQVIESKPKTNVYAVLSKSDGSELGKICWCFGWRQYVFEPNIEYSTRWSANCLKQLENFLRSLEMGITFSRGLKKMKDAEKKK